MPKAKTLQLEPKEAYKIFRMSTELADTLENVFENHGSYSPDFARGLTLSQKQARNGKAKKISSLKDLR